MNRQDVIDHLKIIRTWAAVGKDPIYRGIEPKCCEDVERWIDDALEMLKKQEPMTPEEFKDGLLKMFSSIWECEIDHPVFQDTIGELMNGVMQLYKKAVKFDA